MEEHDFVVVGTSFSALSACMYLVQQGIKPIVIDSDSKQSKEYLNRFIKPNLKRPFGLKNQYKNSYVYAYPKSKILKSNIDQLFGPTFSTGGYSEVWGGVVDDSEALLASFLNIKGKEINEILNFIKQWLLIHEIDEKNKNLKFFTNISTTHENMEINSGQFAGNISINGQNEVINFKTSLIFDYLTKEKLVEIRKDLVLDKIEKDIDGNTVLILMNDNKVLKMKAATLYLATGVSSTAQILLASNIIEKAIIKDSQLILMPILKFGKALDQKLKIQNTSHPIFIMKSINKQEGTFYAQVYNLETEMLKRFNDTKFKFALKLFTTIILKYFGVIFCYLNENESGSLSMSYNGKEYVMDTHNNLFDKRRFIRNFNAYNKALFKIGCLPLVSFMRVMYPGDGFHAGHLHGYHRENCIETELVDVNGNLKGFNKTYLIDSSSLKFISAGPITLAIMINSIRIVKKSLFDLKSSNFSED